MNDVIFGWRLRVAQQSGKTRAIDPGGRRQTGELAQGGIKIDVLDERLGLRVRAGSGRGPIASGRRDMQAALPFGTFLAVGAIVAAVYGDVLLTWYISLYS